MAASLDDFPFENPDSAPTTNGAEGRKCRRHQWRTVTSIYRAIPADQQWTHCARCGAIRSPERAHRGKSARRLGADQERRSERVYGWEKIGERGSITDLRGRMFKVQQKATRRAAPAQWRGIFRELDTVADGRVPLLQLSFVCQGRPTEDYFVLRGSDWLALHGQDNPEDESVD